MGLAARKLRMTATGGAFTDPTDLANLAAWYDASDTASITDAAGIISAWNDKSGNANHLGVLNGDTYTDTRTKNSLNAVECFAASRLQSTASIQDATQTWYVVCEADSINARSPVSLGVPGSSTLGFYPYLNTSGTWLRMGQGAGEISASPSGSVPYMMLWHMKFTGGASAAFQGFLDGTEYTASGSVGSYTPGSTDRIVVGGLNRPSNQMLWDGAICEIAIYTDLHSDTDRDTVMGYLETKWGTT